MPNYVLYIDVLYCGYVFYYVMYCVLICITLFKIIIQNDVFTGFLDPENVGVAIGIAFLSALDSKLQTVMFNTAAILESNMADTGSSN